MEKQSELGRSRRNKHTSTLYIEDGTAFSQAHIWGCQGNFGESRLIHNKHHHHFKGTHSIVHSQQNPAALTIQRLKKMKQNWLQTRTFTLNESEHTRKPLFSHHLFIDLVHLKLNGPSNHFLKSIQGREQAMWRGQIRLVPRKNPFDTSDLPNERTAHSLLETERQICCNFRIRPWYDSVYKYKLETSQ